MSAHRATPGTSGDGDLATAPDSETPKPSSGTGRRWLAIAMAIPLIGMLGEALLVFVVCIPPSRTPGSLSWDLRAESTEAGGAVHVDIRGENGQILRGEFLGDPALRPVVVFGHSYRSNHHQALPLARALLAEGYSVLSFDFRGCGDSDGTLSFCGAVESEDVLAVLRYLTVDRSIPPDRIAYVGTSMGAAAFLVGADQAVSKVAACALLAPYADLKEAFDARTRQYAGLCIRPWFLPAVWFFGQLAGRSIDQVRPANHARALIGIPSLWVSGSEDWRAPARDIKDMAEEAGGSLVALDGADHIDISRPGKDATLAVVSFLSQHLPVDRP